MRREKGTITDLQAGWQPLVIVGTAGTTSAGPVDPLARLADVAIQHGAWFHVDAARGGGAALSSRLKALLTGIERANAIYLSLRTPTASSAPASEPRTLRPRAA